MEGLYDVRRWLIRLLFTEAWLFAALAGLLSWSRLSATDRAALAASAALVIVGWSLSRRTVGLWLITAAPLCLVAATVLSGVSPGAARWVALGVSTGHVAYGLVLLTPRRIGIVAVAACSAALALVWALRPSNVVPGALDVAGGWISVVSLGLSASVLWYVWHALLDQARADDARMRQVSDRLQEELAAQERSRIWRATVVSVHERLLSTLRYVLQADHLDREGLGRLIGPDGANPPITNTPSLAEDVREATAARIAAGIIRVDASVLELPLSDDVRAAARSAIVECALNAVLHGDATDVHVTARRSPDSCLISVDDNGTGVPADAKPGLGWTTTLDEGLGDVGGSWSHARVRDRTVVTLTVPALADRSRPDFDEDGFQQGRILISAPLVTVGIVGVAYDVLAGLAAPRGWPLVVTALLASIGAVVLVARRRRPSLVASSAVILGLAGIPWLLAVAGAPASAASASVAGLTTAGYALIAVGVWSRWWQWVTGLCLWAAGVLTDASVGGIAGQDPLPIVVALVNCLIIVPVVVVVAAIGSRRFQRAQASLALEREAMNRELSRANTAIYIDQHLSACVAQADGIIAELARGEELDEERREQVACLEGLIRATIQVDPIDSGEFTRVAARLVNSAFSVGIPAMVGTLVSSSDRTPLETDLILDLEALIRDSSSLTVRTLNDGMNDYLSLELRDTGNGAGARLSTLEGSPRANVRVEAATEPDGSVVVMVSRPISVLTS